jgi:fucose permease
MLVMRKYLKMKLHQSMKVLKVKKRKRKPHPPKENPKMYNKKSEFVERICFQNFDFRMMKVNQVMYLGTKVKMNLLIVQLMLMHQMKNFTRNF